MTGQTPLARFHDDLFAHPLALPVARSQRRPAILEIIAFQHPVSTGRNRFVRLADKSLSVKNRRRGDEGELLGLGRRAEVERGERGNDVGRTELGVRVYPVNDRSIVQDRVRFSRDAIPGRFVEPKAFVCEIAHNGLDLAGRNPVL